MKENPLSFFLICHERIAFHKPRLMEYTSQNHPIWTGGTFQKEDGFFWIASRENTFVCFSENFVVFLKKATEAILGAVSWIHKFVF